MKSHSQKKAYAQAGVDVDLGNAVKSRIHELVQATHGPEVLGKVGGFGGLFLANFKNYEEPVLVSSVDGVGTKLKIAFLANKHDTVGQDLVNHCINDIAVIGAQPLFFLDYIGAESLDPAVFHQLLAGFTKACKEGGCALIGGETAQMPGMYQKGEYDLAGCIVGIVDRKKILDAKNVQAGDVILGIPSNGLHTNGYSLARKALLEKLQLKIEDLLPGGNGIPGGNTPLGEELLRIHRNYQPLIASLAPGVLKAAAHITGGGLIDNLPRALPEDCDAVIETSSWNPPPIFPLIQHALQIDPTEMFQVFNMGIGMTLLVSEQDARRVAESVHALRIGRIERGNRQVHLVE